MHHELYRIFHEKRLQQMKAKLFEFAITGFEEVYAIIDNENQRLHVSSVNRSFSTTLELAEDMNAQMNQKTAYEDENLNQKVTQVLTEIIELMKKTDKQNNYIKDDSNHS